MKAGTVAKSLFAVTLLIAGPAFGQDEPPSGGTKDSSAELAKKLQNPVAALISVPLQSNFDYDGGPEEDGFQYRLNIQPVIPIALGGGWNLISRTILPVISQHDLIGTSSQSGLGDTVQSLFLSPERPSAKGWVWGLGPVLLIPTATDDLLGAKKWGAGPTGVVLRQEAGWTYGALVNHIWSFAGDEEHAEVNATFLQPFLAYTTRRQTTFSINSESTYDWLNDQWTAPLNLTAAQLVKLGKLPVQFQLGYRDYLDTPENGPDWGWRFSVVFLFPR